MNARKPLAACLGCAALLAALLVPGAAQADFGIKSFSATATEIDGTPDFQAGSHPYEYTVEFEMNRDSSNRVEGTLRELVVELPPGLVGNPQALPRCRRADFDFNLTTTCPAETQVGYADIDTGAAEIFRTGVYNLAPSPGSPVTLGLTLDNNTSLQEASLRSDSDFGARVTDLTVPTKYEILSVTEHIWGVPTASSHDPNRLCIPADPELAAIFGCSSDGDPAAFLTLPPSCTGPLQTTLSVSSVENPSDEISASVLSESEGSAFGMDGCNRLEFDPTITSQPTTNLADSPSGLDFDLHVPQPPAVKQEPGQPESCGIGHWEGEPSDYAYRWLHNGAPIPGAETSEYVTEEADAGKALQCEVTAVNTAGEGHATSPAMVIAPAPATAPPTAATPTVEVKGSGGNQTAGCDPGAWGGEPTFAYQWFKNGSPVAGQNAQTYLTPGAPPFTLQCQVTATNGGGSAVAFSANALSDGVPAVKLPGFSALPQITIAESALPLATAPVKDTTVTLPPGMTLNPAAGNGLEACSEQQIGYLPQVPGVRFSAAPQSCPDTAKVGSLEVSSPLLDHQANGAVYLAEPYQNPFGSLLAIYLAVEDPQTGIFAKLAGKVVADPRTGQLTTTVTANPQLPLEDVVLHFFKGPRAALKTPLACGTYTTTSTLVPWSTPEGADVHPLDSFATSVNPGGGTCPTSEANAPNNPAFSAGTIAPQAAAYSPFVLKLSRPDGSQQLTGLDATLPEGLTGKLAGIPYCSEAQINQAKSREAPNQGAVEKNSPGCPLASEVGSVTVGAGAGITPLYVGGHAYLAGPYKGAPLSLAIITPAVAGPFDLGAVVVRTALYVNPESARIHAVSDPLPSILQGIPLDLRSIALKMDRPDFILNPTSCDPMAITTAAATLPGQSAALNSRFQVGGCSALKFKPRLAISLKGGTKRNRYPALKAIVTYPKGGAYANIASAQVTLPHSAFLEQAHIGTVCTRVQFAAEACPAASIYGKARAFTPLLDKPVEGPVYLRSSSHELPDLVAALRGQVNVDLVGRVDTGKGGGIRNTFEAVPDAPVSKFVLEMKGGRKGLLVNSENICHKPQRALVSYTAHNGDAYRATPLIGNDCGKKAKKKHKAKKHHKARR